MFTFFLVGEDLSQRMRRMSADKPELFHAERAAAAAATAVAGEGFMHSEDESDRSLKSHVLLEASNLPIVIVTNAVHHSSEADNPLTALNQL